MDNENEYADLSFEKLLLKALDSREDTAPLLAEAQRRDQEKSLELAAVVGKAVGAEWTPVGALTLDDGKYQIAVCMRLKPAEVQAARMAQPNVSRVGGGSWRDKGRNDND